MEQLDTAINQNITTEPNPKRQKISSSHSSSIPFTKQELNVGIHCFIGNESLAFCGVLKERYSDFLVNEIDLDGNVEHLTTTNCEKNNANNDNSHDYSQASNENVSHKLIELVGQEVFQQIAEFAQKSDIDSITLPKDDNKQHRTQVHSAINLCFGHIVHTETIDCAIKVVRGKSSTRPSNQRKNQTSEGFTSFLLYKENKDTNEALNVLSKKLGVPINAFNYAGTKDKRGITVQRVTICGISPQKLSALNSKLYGFQLGNFCTCSVPLKLGDLKGNQFRIIIRDVDCTEKLLETSIENIKTSGFINYYGLQRFGSGNIGTHQIGAALLRCDYEKAFHLILDPRENENEECAAARKYFAQTGDIKGTLKKLPKQMHIEKMVVEGLQKSRNKNDYLCAIQALPRNVRTMYVRAYQSYVWNHMASKRIQLWGPNLHPGDLVADRNDCSKLETEAEDVNVDNPSETTSREKQYSFKGTKIFVVSADDVASGNFSVEDIVLPLPGFDCKYPENEIGSAYNDLMLQDGIDTTHLSHKVKEFSLPGGFRKLIEKPQQIEWKLFGYDDAKQDLLLSDLDAIKNRPHPEHKSISESKFKAIELCFKLSASSYATMFFRELLKKTASHKID